MMVIDRAPAWRRICATVLDNSVAALPLALVAGVNIAVSRSGRNPPIVLSGQRARQLVPWCVTLPAATLLGLVESRGGSPGKRIMGLTLVEHGGNRPVHTGRSLRRSLLKTALPWELGHQAVWEFKRGTPRHGKVLAVASLALLGAQVAGALRGEGRTYPDLLSGSTVAVERDLSAPPRLAPDQTYKT